MTKEITNAVVSVGIDIGTTTVSAVAYDIDNKKQLEAFSIPHNSYICSDTRSEQSVPVIIEKAKELLFSILADYKNVVSIGVTGQMHGIVYIDADCNALSNLINWQDRRAEAILENGENICKTILAITGENVFSGYGIATHYYNVHKGEVPDGAVGFCSIMDYFIMKICGIKKTVTHTSVASSFGMFDVEKSQFKKDKLALLEISEEFLPCVTEESLIVGRCNGIPVSVAIGDNQASFLGSVKDNSDTLLINIGTGSQISAVGDYAELKGDTEVRPFIEGKFLLCGSALCGGYAYSMLEGFFRSYMVYAGANNEPQYKVLNQLANEAYERGEEGLLVDTSFSGKRSNPNLKGSINNIDRHTFTPSNLALGVLKGMCNELYNLYEKFPQKRNKIVASGGAVKRIDVLKNLLSGRFGMSVSLNTLNEEAARGAALFSALADGKIGYDNGFSEYIS